MSSSARRKASKYSAVILGLFMGFGFMATANATYTGMVLVTCTNGTFPVGWDNNHPAFEGKGNIAAYYCDIIHHTGYVSDNLTNDSLRWYNGVVPVTSIPETQPATSSPDTSSVSSSGQGATPSSSTPETQTPPAATESVTPVVDTSTSVASPVETLTSTSESSTVSSQTETTTVPAQNPLPTPEPAVEPQQPVAPAPQPETPSQPAPVQDPLASQEQSPSVIQEVPQDEPVAEPQQPAEELPVSPSEEEQPLPQDEPSPAEEPSPIPQPEPEQPVIPEPTSQPDNAYVPPTVTLANGVILTQEVAAQVEMLQNPTELLSELFTNPAAAIAALGAVGADMSPQARAKAKKAVVQAVVVGSIVTQAAGAAAYRRKP